MSDLKRYIKDGTLIIQARTIKEAISIDKIVVYADTYKQEYYMPLPATENKGDLISRKYLLDLARQDGAYGYVSEYEIWEAPSIKIEGDLISRQDVIQAIADWTVKDRPNMVMPTDLVYRIDAIPSAEKVGEWVIDRYDLRGKETCSVCGQDVIGKGWDRLYAYCPNCGARMERSK